LRQISNALTDLEDFPFTAEEQRKEAEALSSKLSIQEVQPKLSVKLNAKRKIFEIVDRGGRYIFKPQVERFKSLPENEDATMKLASISGIEVPFHGLIYSKDGSLTYFIRRFDRQGQKGKLHVEDFAQLSGESRDTKYNSSMENVAKVIEEHCSFPAIEKLKLLKRVIFSFLIGNEDMHLKNFSLIVRDEKVELSPAYDLVSSTLVIAKPKEELALPIRGKKSKLNRSDFIDYFGVTQLELSKGNCERVLDEFKSQIPSWMELIKRSFLSPEMRLKYLNLIASRASKLEN
jgi:serine/threonine-protein kinase HipA